jgi:hypothetical protein
LAGGGRITPIAPKRSEIIATWRKRIRVSRHPAKAVPFFFTYFILSRKYKYNRKNKNSQENIGKSAYKIKNPSG